MLFFTTEPILPVVRVPMVPLVGGVLLAATLSTLYP